MLPIWYGKPGIDEIMLARDDEIVLGGPVAKPFTHFCPSCQETFPGSED